MPTGTPYSSFVAPYDIRVDDFSDPTNLPTRPLLHLLSHTHSDHINGLSSKHFGQTVYCSVDAKEMLLRHEVYAERQLKETGARTEIIRTFQHLKVKPFKLSDGSVVNHGARDLLVSVNSKHSAATVFVAMKATSSQMPPPRLVDGLRRPPQISRC